MRWAIVLAALIAATAAARSDELRRDITCWSGGHVIVDRACGGAVVLGPNQVAFTPCDTHRRVWVHADCLVGWDAPVR